MRRKAIYFLSAFLLLFLLAGCASTGGSESVSSPEPTTALPATLTPSASESETRPIDVGPVIARLGSLDCVDACVGHTFAAPPDVILYADGRLITNEMQEGGTFSLQERQLSRQQMCALLNTVEQTGFFDYDTTEYEQAAANAGLASNTWLEVNGTRSKQMRLHALREFMAGADYLQVQYEVEPALRDTYRLLESLPTLAGESTPYQPERVAVWLKPIADLSQVEIPDERGEWPLESPMLAELLAQTIVEPENGIVEVSIDGPNAAALYELFEGAPYPHSPRVYTEEGQMFAIAVRALLPYETSGGQTGQPPQIPSPDLLIEPIQLTCSPDDGLMEIP